MTRVWVEPISFDQGRRKNDALTHLATLPTIWLKPVWITGVRIIGVLLYYVFHEHQVFVAKLHSVLILMFYNINRICVLGT